MHIPALGGAAKLAALPPLEPAKEKFSAVLRGPKSAPGPGKSPPDAPVKSAAPGKSSVEGAKRAAGPAPKLALAIDQVSRAQSQLDRVLAMAQSGKTFTPAQLLALQAQVSQASNELDLAGKVVDKGTGGVKQLLTTQI